MSEKLAILVASDSAMTHVLGISNAAIEAKKRVDVFFTGKGVCLTQDPRFSNLLEIANVSVCETSYFANGYQGKPIAGLTDKDFVTQGRNAEMVEESDRYIVL